MTLEMDFKKLVQKYAQFDEATKSYSTLFSEEERAKAVETKKPPILSTERCIKLETYLIRLFDNYLLSEGISKEKISSKYKRISLYVHPDKAPQFSPELIWLGQNLSRESSKEAVCFKIATSCYEKFTSPQKFKQPDFNNFNTRADWEEWLVGLKNNTTNLSKRHFYASLLGLFHDSCDFFDDVGKIKPQALKIIIGFIPMVFSSYGAILFAEELFSIYAISLLVLTGGKGLEKTQVEELKTLGSAFQNMSVLTATATTTVLARLIEMSFWASHHCFNISLSIGSTLLKPFITPSAKTGSYSTPDHAQFYSDLIGASLNDAPGKRFKTPELKLLAAPLETYHASNVQQLFGDWRKGKKKQRIVEACLFRLRVIDKLPRSLDIKLTLAQAELNKLKENKKVYVVGGEAAKAIDRASQAYCLLTHVEEPSTTKLLECKS